MIRPLFPPFDMGLSHRLEREGQTLWVEESGNPEGIPVLFLHGGPGSGCTAEHRRFFDHQRLRILLHDQRGCGLSHQGPGLSTNSTDEILKDLEFIREHLGIERWILFGGSWGATLGLLYAESFPATVYGLVLRGTFLARKQDLEWFLGETGVRKSYPEAWKVFCSAVGWDQEGLDPLLDFLYRGVMSEDLSISWPMAQAWERWGAVVTLGDPKRPPHPFEAGRADAMVRKAQIELHYARHAYFIRENQILENTACIPGIPTVIIHGDKDHVCPVSVAYELADALPNASLRILKDSGHIPNDDAMISALIEAVEDIAQMEVDR